MPSPARRGKGSSRQSARRSPLPGAPARCGKTVEARRIHLGHTPLLLILRSPRSGPRRTHSADAASTMWVLRGSAFGLAPQHEEGCVAVRGFPWLGTSSADGRMTKPSAGSRPGEDELIARYFAPIAGEGALGLKDDVAVLRPRPGHDLVVTVDAVVAGVHFFADDPAGSVARKALGVNLSDLAAKGAAPVGFVLTLTLPPDWSEDWLAAFCEGLGAAARASGCALLGGDTVRGPGIAISLTAFGEVPAGGMVERTTARPGEVLCVSGTIGDAALGLAVRGSSVPSWGPILSRQDR